MKVFLDTNIVLDYVKFVAVYRSQEAKIIRELQKDYKKVWKYEISTYLCKR